MKKQYLLILESEGDFDIDFYLATLDKYASFNGVAYTLKKQEGDKK
jgi:hypothetical protein